MLGATEGATDGASVGGVTEVTALSLPNHHSLI
jgi:hypothetical protein